MSQIWVGPLLLVALCLIWFAVQRAWLACMGEPPEKDALERPGYCGTACTCRGDCPRRGERAESAVESEES